MQTTANLPISVTATTRSNMEARLDAAVIVAKRAAMRNGTQGILVTRLDYGSFTVDLSDSVPFGLTREHHAL
ncbi:hypothetical protein ACIPWF_19450 [Paenarthrobacter sp. NPDC089989]|uniref:hypothetical protein n=1 Tax=unclassified Paenarthrobacter TaxID=2634190 RepID=UPI0038229F56